jgi:hypothetical protein
VKRKVVAPPARGTAESIGFPWRHSSLGKE